MTEELDVLIVDDEKFIGDEFEQFLKQYPIQFRFVTKVKDAIHLAKKHHPRVVFVDIFLPELDGFDLAEEIFSYVPSATIILMSGLYDFNLESLKQLGFDDFIKKPIQFDQVKSLLQKHKIID